MHIRFKLCKGKLKEKLGKLKFKIKKSCEGNLKTYLLCLAIDVIVMPVFGTQAIYQY